MIAIHGFESISSLKIERIDVNLARGLGTMMSIHMEMHDMHFVNFLKKCLCTRYLALCHYKICDKITKIHFNTTYENDEGTNKNNI